LRDVAKLVQEDRLLIETDTPYLAPVPHRGRPNEPAFLPLVAATVAAARGCPPEHLAALTTANAHRLFGV
jgi:TatD DNase family protein